MKQRYRSPSLCRGLKVLLVASLSIFSCAVAGAAAPTIADNIDDFTVLEDAGNTTINLGNVFSGANSYELVDNDNESLVTASISGSTLTLDYQSDENGVATIEVKAINTADDPDTETSDTFEVTVNGVPDVVDNIDDFSVDEDDGDTAIDLDDVFEGADSYEVLSNDTPTLVMATISGSTLTLDYLDDQNGAAVIQIKAINTAIDPDTDATDEFTVTVNPVADMAEINFSSSPGAQSVDDDDTVGITPFTEVTIIDVDDPDDLVVEIELLDNDPAPPAPNGVLTDDQGVFTAASLTASGFTKTGEGTYQLSGSITPAQATTKIRELSFAPFPNRKPVDETEDTYFRITVTSAEDPDPPISPAVDETTLVRSLSINDAPVVVKEDSEPGEEPELEVFIGGTLIPLIDASITDVDLGTDEDLPEDPADRVGQLLTVTLTLTPDEGSLESPNFPTLTTPRDDLPDGPSFSRDEDTNTYKLTGFDQAAITTELQQLVYRAQSGFVDPSPRTVNILIAVEDEEEAPNGPSLDSEDERDLLIANPPVTLSGTISGQALFDNSTISPFSSVVMENPAPADIKVTITTPDPRGEFTNLGSFTGSIDDPSGGLIFIGDAAAATVAIRALSFNPEENVLTAAGTVTFTISLLKTDDTFISADSSTTITITPYNDAPTISGITNLALSTDDETSKPFAAVKISDPDEDGNQLLVASVRPDNPEKGTLRFAISQYSDGGTGVVMVTSPKHGLLGGDNISISGSGGYDGDYTVSGVTDDTFEIAVPGEFLGDVEPKGGWTSSVFFDVVSGVYSFGTRKVSATAAQVRLRSLEYVPTEGRNAEGVREAVQFTLLVEDSKGESDQNSDTRILVEAVNSAPKFFGITDPLTLPPALPIQPFANITVDEDESNVDLTIALDDPAKAVLRFSISGFATGGTGFTLVSSANHGLLDGAVVEISGYGGTGPYNGTHVISSVTPGTFLIPVDFDDDVVPTGGWMNDVFLVGDDYFFADETPANLATLLDRLELQIIDESLLSDPGAPFPFDPGAFGEMLITLTAQDQDGNAPVTESFYLQFATEPRTHLVTSLSDDPNEEGSLRHAVLNSFKGDHITFALESYGPPAVRLYLGKSLILNRDVTINGPGPDKLIISGDGNRDGEGDVKIFEVNADVTITGLTLEDGNGLRKVDSEPGDVTPGGAIAVTDNGNLVLSYCVVKDSVATQWGGGLDVAGTVSVDHCLFVNNATNASLGRAGGAISIFSDQPCTISNTTFSGNQQRATSALGGGALYVENRSAGSELKVSVVGCTFAENIDASEQASSVKTNVFNTSVRMKNCIVADGSGSNLDVVGGGRIISEGNNISDDSTEHIFTQGNTPRLIRLFDQAATDQVNTDPLLLPLADNFGPTKTHALRNQSASSIDLGAAFSVFEAKNGDVAFEILSNTEPGLFVDNSVLIDQGSGFLNMSFKSTVRGVAEIVVRAEATSFPGTFQDKTFTIATGDSPAIDNGALDDLLGTDQRGFWRDSGNPDIGALESDANHRIVINEIKFNPDTGEFVEFYVLPESDQVDVEGFTVWVGGQLWHTFTDIDAVMNPDEGIVVEDADAMLSAIGSGLQTSTESTLGADDLKDEGDTVTLKDRDGRVLTSVTYNGRFNGVTLIDESITMGPQFMGAFVPHSTVPDGRTDSPGAEANGRPFDGSNAPPTAVHDLARTDEDHDLNILALANDNEPDAADTLRVVTVGASTAGASITINDDPRVGASIIYDPRGSSAAQALPVGSELIDEFSYVILDYHDGMSPHAPRGDDPTEIATNLAKATSTVTVTVVGLNDLPTPADDLASLNVAGGALNEVTPIRILGDANLLMTSPIFDPDAAREIIGYAGTAGQQPVIVTVPNHGLDDGRTMTIAGYGGDPSYNDTFTVSYIDANRFSIPISYVDEDVAKGEMVAHTDLANTESALRAICDFSGTVGAAPVSANAKDHGLETGDQITIAGYGGDPTYNGVFTVAVLDSETFTIPINFVDNDATKGQFKKQGNGGLLTNDSDRDSDDDHTTLRVAGLVTVNQIDTYSGLPGASPVTVTSVTPHGLSNGDSVIISDPCADPFYDGVHVVEVLNENEFSIPVPFMGVPPDSAGRWVLVPETPSLETRSVKDATVILDVRANREETNLLYDPTTSDELNSLRATEPTTDSFGYLVIDQHEGLGFAVVNLIINGVNDVPVAFDDAGEIVYGVLEEIVVLATDEDTNLDFNADALLANDTDEDGNDTLTVIGVSTSSTLGATVSLTGNTISYNPDNSAALEMLSRGEVIVDTFTYTIEDSVGATAEATVSVQVVGVNDTPTTSSFSYGFTSGSEVLEDETLNVGASLTTGILSGSSDEDMNDNDPDDTLGVVSIINGITNNGARYTINPDGSFTYDPTTSDFFNGLAAGDMEEDSFDFEVVDHSLTVANDDLFSVAASSSANELRVLANDSDLAGSGGVLTISGVGVATRGLTEVSTDGQSVVYTPQPNFNGDDSFTYEISDGKGGRDIATVTVRVIVQELNGNLQALDDQFSVARGTTSSLAVLNNDNILPANGQSLVIDFVSSPDRGGSAVANNSGPIPVIAYTPDPGYTGLDPEVFTYVISAGGIATAQATITVNVVDRMESLGGANGVLRNDVFSVLTGSTGNSFDVLANDNILPATGEGLSITAPGTDSETATPHGKIVLQEAESGSTISYTPNSGFVGMDTFTYAVDDGFGGTGSATVTVMVGSLTTNPDFFSTGGAFEILGYSGTTAVKVSAPQHGLSSGDEITISGYGGDASYNDSFLVTVVNVNEFTIPIPFADDAANKGVFVASERLDVLANDDILGTTFDEITITNADLIGDKGGSIEMIDAGKALRYTPDSTRVVPYIETFTYEISNTDLTSTAVGSVTIAVTNAVPRASNDAFTVLFNSSENELDVLANDKQLSIPADSQILSITGLGTGPDGPDQGGTVAISNGGNYLIYSPVPNFAGEEVFTYQITDDRGMISTATAIVRVTPGTLKAGDDFYTVFKPVLDGDNEQSPFVLSVLGNDVNLPDSGRSLTISALGIDAHGTDGQPGNDPDMGGRVEIGNAGSLRYFPDPDFGGTYPYWETFTYEISDGSLSRSQGTVAIRVFDRENTLGTPGTSGGMAVYNDEFTVERDSGGNVLAVLANDAILPATSDNWTISHVTDPVRLAGGPPEVDNPATGEVEIVGQSLVYTPPTGFVGVETFEYAVDDGLGGTGSAVVTVNVGYRPTNDDSFSALENSIANELDVLANDRIVPDTRSFAIVAVGTEGASGSGSSAEGGSLEIAATKDSPLNIIIFKPAAGFVGVDRFQYTIEDDTGGQSTANVSVTVYAEGSDRAQGTVTIKVTGVNDAPEAEIAGDPLGQTVYYRSTVFPFLGVNFIEVDDAGQEQVTVTIELDGTFAPGSSESHECEDKITATLLTYIGPDISGPTTVVFDSKDSSATYNLPNGLFSGDTLKSAAENDFTIDARTDGQDYFDSNMTITINGVDELHHTSCSVPYESQRPAPLDDPKGDPSSLWFVERFVDKDGNDSGPLGSSTPLLEGDFDDQGEGVFTFTGTAAEATAAIRGLAFRPYPDNANDIFTTSSTTTFTITVDDGSEGVTLTDAVSVTALPGFVQKVVSPEPSRNDNFGDSVATSGDVVVVGTPFGEKNNGNSTGAVYIFARQPGTFGPWTEVQRLQASNGSIGDEFGSAVAISESGQTIVVGAPRRGAGGAIFVLELDAGGQWQEVAELTTPSPESGDEFGTSVGISGDIIVAGAPEAGEAGLAIVFERDSGGGWGDPGQLLISTAQSDDEFGTSVGVSGSVIIVGAPKHGNGNLSTSGNALMFERGVGGSWSQFVALKPSNLSKDDYFGTSVAIHGETVIAGAPGKGFGTAFVLKRSGGTWNPANLVELEPFDGQSNDKFGQSVSIARDFAVVSSWFDDDQGRNSGAAYVYGRDNGGMDSWGLTEKMLPLDGESNDNFGFAVAVSRETVAVGSNFAGPGLGRSDAGSAYIFSLKFNNAPLVLEPIPDQSVVELSPFNLVVPGEIFADPDVRDSLILSAGLGDGSELPLWLNFDPGTGTFSGTPNSTDVGMISVVLTATDEDSLTATATFLLTVTPGGPFLERGVLPGVDDNWTTVQLSRTYASMVIIATPSYDENSSPLVTRIRNADPNSDQFEIKVQPVTPSPAAVTPVNVHFMVLEEGTYTEEQHGVKMEAVKFLSSVTDGVGSWVGTSRTYQQAYDAPVVFGQIMSTADTGFSTFWSRGPDRGTPATRTELWVGKHSGEDPNPDRDAETIGYIVIEEGGGEMNGTGYFAALGADAVSGMDDSAPYVYSVSGMTATASAVLTQAGMDGDGGGWAALYGSDPLTDTRLQLVIDEDQLGDLERNHTTEQVSCLIFEDDPEYFSAQPLFALGASIEMDPVENWRTENFSEAILSEPLMESQVWGLHADPDQDGRTNLHEYAVGSSPDRRAVFDLPSVRVRVGEGGNVVVEYERRTNDPRLKIRLKESPDFIVWNPLDTRYNERVEDSRDGFERVITTIPRAPSGRNSYFRLEFEYEPIK